MEELPLRISLLGISIVLKSRYPCIATIGIGLKDYS
jgi:hypothetical protein